VEQKERIIVWAAICISAIAIAVVVILAIRDQQPAAEQTHTEHHHEHRLSEPPVETAAESTKTHADVTPASRPSLNEGRTAPDFTLTDIIGKEHKLSDYRGKDVMIIFWATWCGPCLIEIPHLMALRSTVNEDKLTMLAISNENPALVKNFVANRKINYTVFSSNTFALPSPYSRVRSIPCSFFIDSQGRIKLATEGTLSLGDMKAILRAQ
jgi:peroxiredoxin/heme exporter protein D